MVGWIFLHKKKGIFIKVHRLNGTKKLRIEKKKEREGSVLAVGFPFWTREGGRKKERERERREGREEAIIRKATKERRK